MRFRFRDCVVDADLFELRRGGERVEVQPKVLALLLFLLENRDRTVTKSEILAAVWPGTATGEGSLTRAVSFARDALGDARREAGLIRTVRGRGYRIGVPVVVESAGAAASTEPVSRSDFVCREQELGLARDALVQALSGHGQVLLLVGEPGIGKTRLAEEIGALARERGARVCWGRCREDEGAPAFWPWVQVLRAYLDERGPDALAAHLGGRAADLAEIVPEVRDALPDLPPPDLRDARQARFRLFDAVTALLRAASAERPLVVVLDDAQSADEPSLALLRFLAPELRGSPTLVVVTYRDVELRPGHRLEGTLAELVRSQRPRRTILLRGLTQGCVRRFTERFAGIAPSDALVESLYRRTEGNPLFLIELLQWLQGRDELGPEPQGAWDDQIPEGVRHVIGRRLEGLSPACHRALEHAAVVGRDFALPVLASVCEISEAELLERLGEAERTRIVEPVRDRPGRFRFTHGLIAETLRDRMGTAACVRLHRRTGEALEKLYLPQPVAKTDLDLGVPDAHLSELAHHFGEAAIAGDADRALDYSVRAGGHAMRVLAFEEAARHYARALGLLDLAGRAAAARRARLLVSLADARYRSGDAAASARSLDQAIESARADGDHESLAEAALRLHEHASLGGNMFVGERGRRRWLEAALEALGDGDSPLRARLTAALGSELLFHGDESRSRALIRDAVAMARRGDEPAVLWSVLQRQRPYWFEPSRDAECEEHIEELFGLARASGDAEREFRARFDFRLIHAIELADPRGIDRELAACARLADELRQPFFRWCVTRAQAARALWQGRIARAEELMLEARDHGRRAGEVADLSYHSGLLSLRRLQGRFAELEPALRADHRLPKERGHKWSGLALLLAESGRVEPARAELAGLAADRFAAIRRDSNYAYNLALLAETCALVADEPRATELREILLPYAGRYLAIPGIVAAGCASRFLGLLATLLRHWDEAEEHFETALGVERRMEARAFEACTERDYARMLAARGERGAASNRRARAEALAREVGLALDAGAPGPHG